MLTHRLSRTVLALSVLQVGAIGAAGLMAAPASAAASPSPSPMSSGTLVSLVVHGVPAAGIAAYTGTYGTVTSGPAGGLDSGTTFPDPDGVLGFVSAAT